MSDDKMVEQNQTSEVFGQDKTYKQGSDLEGNTKCSERDFCDRYHTFIKKEKQEYNVDYDSIKMRGNLINAILRTENDVGSQLGKDLDLEIEIYEQGIARIDISEHGASKKRFSISETGIGVEWSQLRKASMSNENNFRNNIDNFEIVGLENENKTEKYSYTVQFEPFRLEQRVNGEIATVVNQDDRLYFEVADSEGKNAIGMGYFLPASNVFGLPQRANTLNLNDTTNSEPYRMFNEDFFPHNFHTNTSIYGSMPYVTGHKANMTSSVAWMNSAETWVDIHSQKDESVSKDQGKYIHFLSEGGALRSFIFGSAFSPKRNQKNMADLTGYTPMPPLYSLGFHFSKWENCTADMLIQRNKDFNKYGYPVDVFWMDIEHAQDRKYFTFHTEHFNQRAVAQLNQDIEDSSRRLVVITDPHIKASEDNFVYSDGQYKQKEQPVTASGEYLNIFIRDADDSNNTFIGKCWPGDSAWIDFLNTAAQNYWKSLYNYAVFRGTNYLYGIWIDMNEPAVFKGQVEIEARGMPLGNKHMMDDGTLVEHRLVHNAYGSLQHRATYEGLLERDQNQVRPFVLTRSTFLGSQRFSAMWTGDSTTDYGEVPSSINQIMTLGVSGFIFSGSDLPGFFGVPDDNLWVQFYQLGVFFPFFRAHADRTSQMREPWLQSERVQAVVMDAIHQRYAQIHILYDLFFQATTEGLPIVRPTWMEFPKDEATFDLNYQFMFGSDMLVAFKFGKQETDDAPYTEVKAYLPPSADWYNFYSKALVEPSNEVRTLLVPDRQQGTFVRAGAILPILNFSKDRLALLEAIKDPIRLDIYVDPATNTAEGFLYLDDGLSFNHETQNQRTRVQFSYGPTDEQNLSEQQLSVTKVLSDENMYLKASNKFITEVNVYGVPQDAAVVEDKWVEHTAGNHREAKHVYIASSRELRIRDIAIPVDAGLKQGKSVSLLKITF